MHAFILAGGFATRLWPLTETRAKPLLPLAGKPILSSVVERVPEGIPITVSTNAAVAEGLFGWAKTIDRPVEILVEETRHDDHKLGALGAVSQWIERAGIHDDVLLLTGDNYFGFSLSDFLAAAAHDVPLLAAHDIRDRERAKSFGTVILGPDGKTITAFEEKPPEPQSTLVSTGCSLLPASVLPVLVAYAKHHPDNVGGIFEELIRRSVPVECFRFREPWFDIGSFASYLEATKALVGDRILRDPSSLFTQNQTEGSVVIGPACRVENSTLRNTVLFEGCTVEDCVIDHCVIDDRCALKGIDLTGKMLRAGTVLRRL
ncbi:MAG: NDP-sugar synthase [Candidatus Peregrinibacteria bacterium]